jgi:hypothetical protein
MKTIRVIAVLSIVAAAACVSSVERPAAVAADSAAMDAHESIAALHAAIPPSQASGDVFEYSTVVPMPAPDKVAAADPGGQVFEYN